MFKFFIDRETSPASFLGSICYFLGIVYPFANKRTKPHFGYYQLRNMPDLDGNLFFLLAPFQVFLDMVKDMIDIFKPYRYPDTRQEWRDFEQPVTGALNIILGLINLVGSLIAFLGAAFLLILSPAGLFIALILRLTYSWGGLSQDILYALKETLFFSSISLAISTSWTVNAITQLIRGTTQLLATPLTWFIKMPLRYWVTKMKGIPYAEDKIKIRESAYRVMSRLEEIKEDKSEIRDSTQATKEELEKRKVYSFLRETYPILVAIHLTMKQAIKKEQKTMLLKEKQKYGNYHKNKNNESPLEEKIYYAREYLRLFTPVITPTLKKFITFSLCEKRDSTFPLDVVRYIGMFFISESRNYVKSYQEYQQEKSLEEKLLKKKTATRTDHQRFQGV